MGNVEPLQHQAEQYQTMKARLDQLLQQIFNQTNVFNLLDPRSFGYQLSDGSFLIAMLGADPSMHAQHLDYPRSANIEWDKLRHIWGEDFDAALAEGERNITQLQERLVGVRYFLRDLEDKLDMLRRLKGIRDMISNVGAT